MPFPSTGTALRTRLASPDPGWQLTWADGSRIGCDRVNRNHLIRMTLLSQRLSPF